MLRTALSRWSVSPAVRSTATRALTTAAAPQEAPHAVLGRQQDLFYSRIAKKMNKIAHVEFSNESLERTMVFLQALGLSKMTALSCISRHVMMMSYLPSTMAEKVEWLRENGVTGKMLPKAIMRHPNILGVRTEALEGVRDWYINQGVNPLKVPFLLSVFPQIVSTSIPENIEPKLELLSQLGLDQSMIVRILQRTPQVLSMSLDRMRATNVYLRQKGFTEEDVMRFMVLVPESLGLAPESMNAKLDMLNELIGYEGAGLEAWRTTPRLIMTNSYELKRSYEFLISEAGIDPERVRKNISLIMRNVDRILRPRYEFLVKTLPSQSVGLVLERAFWIKSTEDMFRETYPAYEAFRAKYHGPPSSSSPSPL